jgi:beta-glucosidase
VATAFAAAVEAVRGGVRDIDQAVDELLGQLTDKELLWLLDGDTPMLKGAVSAGRRYGAVPFEAGRIDRLGIPGIRFTDGPRGVVVGASTAFPVALARAATWDPRLERAIGDAIGAEARAQGANLFAGICVNLAYAPGWGRSQESYGEEPVLLGEMGAALAEGVNPWVMSCVKHYALNSMEDARFSVDVSVDEDVLREVFLPHFCRVIKAGCDVVMSSYNSVNGTWAGENKRLLTDILRGDWGFSGFVMTDFVFGLRNPVESVAAGQDLEMPFRQQRAAALPKALRSGALDRADVTRAAARILATQVRFALRARPTPSLEVVASSTHRELARMAAAQGTVMLRNEPVGGAVVLPFDIASMRRVAVVGALADQANMGDTGSSRVYPPSTTSVLQGLRDRLGENVVQHVAADAGLAAEAARLADAAVVVVGLSAADEGESMMPTDTDTLRLLGGILGYRPVAALMSVMIRVLPMRRLGGDRRDLGLHAEDIRLIRAVVAANPRTVVIVIGGGTIVLEPWDSEVAAVLLAWYPGMEGGHAIADVLLGDSEPGGRLPLAIPRRAADLPSIDWDARKVTYDRWWGQRKLDHDGVEAAYPFGFGLGYTTFRLRALELTQIEGREFVARVTVTNTGERAGKHVIQIYTRNPDGVPPVRELAGFQAVEIDAGQTVDVQVRCALRPQQLLVEASSYCGDPEAITASFDR